MPPRGAGSRCACNPPPAAGSFSSAINDATLSAALTEKVTCAVADVGDALIAPMKVAPVCLCFNRYYTRLWPFLLNGYVLKWLKPNISE